jgi:hypothetical protein
MARLRHADFIEQCPLSGVTRKSLLRLSSSQFDPSATSGLISLATKQRGAHYPTQDWLSCQMTGPCPGTLRRAICCGIGPNRMVSLSAIVLGRWASRRSSLLRDHPGRTLTSSVSSVRSAANVWITLSSSTSVTGAASCRAIFNHRDARTHLSLNKDCPEKRPIH